MKPVRTYGALVLAGLALGAITVATVLTVNHASEHAGCAILTPFSGSTIATSAIVLLVAGRALMRQRRSGAERTQEPVERHACGSCGHEVYGAWRMCPYCGAMLDDSRRMEGSEVRT